MNIKTVPIAALSLALFANTATAKAFYVTGSLAVNQATTDRGDADLDQTVSPRIIAGFNLTANFATEAGLYYLKTEQGQTAEDTTSQYKTSLTSRDFLLGLKGEFPISREISVYGRGGLLFWNTELETKENFFGTYTGGTRKADDDGIGYYLSIGITHQFNRQLYLDAYIGHHQRDGILKEDSNFPIDLSETLLGVGIGFAF